MGDFVRRVSFYPSCFPQTWDNFICMWANTCRKPTTASHKRLCAKLCWLPVHGPYNNKLSQFHCTGRCVTLHKQWCKTIFSNKKTINDTAWREGKIRSFSLGIHVPQHTGEVHFWIWLREDCLSASWNLLVAIFKIKGFLVEMKNFLSICWIHLPGYTL